MWGGGAQNNGVDFFQNQRLVWTGGDVGNAVFVGYFFGFGKLAVDQRDYVNAVDVFDAVQVFNAKGTCACQGDFDGFIYGFFLMKK